MMTNSKTFIQQRVQEHYDEAVSLGYEVVGVWLQGSQNYQLDIYNEKYQSDVDTKAIILPKFEDIVRGTSPFSHTHVRANNEHIDIKDVRVMFEMFRKQNNSYVEILFTEYCVINPKYQALVDELLSMRDKIVHAHPNQALRCLAGTSMEKYKALEHPYPGTMDKINKFGYDPKQLHHILRINDLMRKYISGAPYIDCLLPDNREYLLSIKQGILPLEEARMLAKQVDEDTKALKNVHSTPTEEIDLDTFALLDELKVKFIRKFLTEELKHE